MSFAAALGYYINDIFDTQKDAIVGKKNFASFHSVNQKILISLLLLFIIFIVWHFLNGNVLVLILILSQILLFFLYSIPLTRLKEKPYIGVCVDSIYAHIIPGAVVLFTIRDSTTISWFLILYLCWLFQTGVRNIINHNIQDYANDLASGTRTIAIEKGEIYMKRVMNFVLCPAEIITFWLLLLNMDHNFPYLILIFWAYVLWVYNRELIFVRANKHNWTPEEQNGYNFIGGVILNEYYEKWFPIVCFILLIHINLWFLLVFCIHVLLFIHNTLDFKKDYLILQNLILSRIAWILIPLGYKVVWTIVPEGYKAAGLLTNLGYFIRYKIFGRIKHVIYWKIYIPLSGKNE